MRSLVRFVALATAIAAFGGCASDESAEPANTNSKELFCNFLLSFRATNDTLTGELASGDAARSQTAVERMVDQVDLLQERAPAEIESDVNVVADYVNRFSALMASHGYDINAVEADPAAAEEFVAITSDEVTASLAQLRAYAEQDCAAEPAD